MTNSRIPAFYELSPEGRRRKLAEAVGLAETDVETLGTPDHLPADVADMMIENAIGTFSLPFGVALNFRVDGRDVIVPMVVEEPSVVAAASSAALVARAGGGFVTESDPGAMIGQIQLVRVSDPEAAAQRLCAARAHLLAAAARFAPGLCARGAGPRDVEVRIVNAEAGYPMVVLHILLDTGDAMGANAVNAVVEGLAPVAEEIAGGVACLRILSNLADHRLARATVRVPTQALARRGLSGEQVAERMLYAFDFADADPYRAATHNKGIMNGIDAVAVATGNDWRAIEAGAHAYAARHGRYRSLSTWAVLDGQLVGVLELPMAVSTVGPIVQSHPLVRLAFRLLGVNTARDLAAVMVSVGLASNLAAMRALASEGIQEGHMALHARAVSRAAGARGQIANEVRRRLIAGGNVKIDRAREILDQLTAGASTSQRSTEPSPSRTTGSR